ncbi:unnamed protein product [Lactuca virosa]|uniref:Uncharacterized protein n=1 Tax=Lactuca virosa TaxID=75947 RepID=A0AAU9PKW6_9ASTR|nr:unnamed protein product [Lactuca virosa]
MSNHAPDNDNDNTGHTDSDSEFYAELASSATWIVNHFRKFEEGKKFSGPRKSNFSSSTSRIFDTGSLGKVTIEKKDEDKCFNYGGTNHLAMDYKMNKNDIKDESYEIKYKRLFASFKKKNMDSKVLLAEVEEWVEEEESCNEEFKGNVGSLMATTYVPFTAESNNNTSTFEAEIYKAARDSNDRN